MKGWLGYEGRKKRGWGARGETMDWRFSESEIQVCVY